MSNQKSILLTVPDGTRTVLLDEPHRRHSLAEPGGVQFDSEQLERGRSRVKAARGIKSNSGSRSRSRNPSHVRNGEFLKWTVLKRDPSMRLHKKPHGNGIGNNADDEEEEEEDEDQEDEDLVSDEEQVSDVENDLEIDEQMHYDMGTRVLPNYAASINEVLASTKSWISTYESQETTQDVSFTKLPGGYSRCCQLLSRGKGATTRRSFVLCTDLTTESHYALAYVIGALLNNGDTLYIVHWDGKQPGSSKETLEQSVKSLRQHVLHKLDCASASLQDLDVVLLSLSHPYPKHLLSEMIYALQPIALCCSLSLVLTTLQNFVCSVPTLVIRKKLKRSKRKGISD
ncbi:ZYRO0B16500p [Zygosaccharomyces rouxii]|uniref:ZYRO0B16500p n=1 Tax=Zygosaccharomyces rouxii (strain ATCC 2623 / CBS 732 / NBRC 1130 / NCYC 568 / NRRL Y-229) TaxID=559307 RepID=C5DSF7_ZYGRC|nr:uncharacterized protein ZYRO0B16500g [Zygosaccharomyces rouxii]KAH9199752.1 hypothetical protein LQ764DRAFT_234376 [Zygosaccharomyces rouxii]CAR26718.1 ZYRO0B16500p [Zygosaccharomyces rouxii]